MKATASLLGVLLGATVLVSSAQAQYGYHAPPAPPMYQPGYYPPNYSGAGFPYYYCNPSFPACPPFQGMVWAPPSPGGNGNAAFPTHPFARSPRDFFMIDFDRDTSASSNPYRIGSVSSGAIGVSGATGGAVIIESATFSATWSR
jgi:hypothetical protein